MKLLLIYYTWYKHVLLMYMHVPFMWYVHGVMHGLYTFKMLVVYMGAYMAIHGQCLDVYDIHQCIQYIQVSAI